MSKESSEFIRAKAQGSVRSDWGEGSFMLEVRMGSKFIHVELLW